VQKIYENMECPKCKNSQYIKSGKLGEKQRYKCKSCNYRYTVTRRCTEKPEELRRMALELYLEGLGFRAIGRVLKISYGRVYKWIKKCGEEASLPAKQQEEVKSVELDELHTYIGSKKLLLGMDCC
jgi:transposase-like protein